MNARKLVLVGVIAGSLALTTTACGGDSMSPAGGSTSAATTADATTVSLKGLTFSPATLTVAVGTTVTWRNDEPITHDVTSGTYTDVDPGTGLRSGETADGMFAGKLGTKGSTFSYTFTKAGTYTYYCSIHDGMNAKVVVTA